ncbi:MAG: 16S rRNA (cytidine(1402)-2'-O)-methyltransferase [Flavobacteriales bacterium]|jgi:16S rRNA (cytidine1402-2'-O)-methyltransferase|uniref:16S rRNA (cytidine(1402)-2'-O)-methyltransferase n=1 Tax=Blattabacterium sp. (Mastotermes darwiniensis) TaxID=39768 RepID=UPI000231DE39|nr:16S rRNA (cytidine(1402)-2'-O)-methyltransferase [Blattabacterium sp. (Mastotermes darwiniensis)]AER40621.1 putative methyltransferase [Blattabacterium sp. (Mastotermes darwiniensis) str. MADAR]MDR1804732.1 16S rRNA (cytidine(1402)-2'-O)-methyltransferase [Flavobacteriales bacterium]
MLYIVPTPIGNLEDITFRSLRILKEVDLILTENYKISKKLLNFYNVKTSTKTYHIYNERKKIPFILKEIKNGKNLALISNAGTPSISDPGFLLIKNCIKHSIEIECLPGPTSIIPALVISGFPINEFTFIGFLPKKKRKMKLEKLSKENRTFIFYESPHRLLRTLNDLKDFFGLKRKIVICKEISKIFQETLRGNIKDMILYYENVKKIFGEYILILDKKNENE